MWVIFKEQLFLFMCWPKGGEKEGKGGWVLWLAGRVWVAGAELLSLATCQRLGQCTFNVGVVLPVRWCSVVCRGELPGSGKNVVWPVYRFSFVSIFTPDDKPGCHSSISGRWHNTTVDHLEELRAKRPEVLCCALWVHTADVKTLLVIFCAPQSLPRGTRASDDSRFAGFPALRFCRRLVWVRHSFGVAVAVSPIVWPCWPPTSPLVFDDPSSSLAVFMVMAAYVFGEEDSFFFPASTSAESSRSGTGSVEPDTLSDALRIPDTPAWWSSTRIFADFCLLHLCEQKPRDRHSY